MKIYISTDLEGICGVFSKEHLFPGGNLYAEARKLLTMQVNAAVEGCFAGGADDVIVLDGHGGACHLILDDMNEQAQYIQGSGRDCWLPFLQGSDGLLIIGAHAKAGTDKAVLDHTQSLQGVYSISINGREVGEIGQTVALAGAWNVPLLMVSGDDKACTEAEQLVPGIETAVVKQAISRSSALHLHPRAACRKIRTAAEKAIALVGTIKPYELEKPVVVRITLTTTDLAQQTLQGASRQCQARLIDPRTVELRADDIRKIGP